MKNYLYFSTDGDIEQLETKLKIFVNDNYKEYNFIETIEYNKYNFIILFNKNNDDKKNLTVLPFYNKDIYGAFVLFAIDQQNNIKSFTEKKFLQLISKKIKSSSFEDYSSDDFNLSDD